MAKNILITGKPRSGKSTLLQKLIQDFSSKVGFITLEIPGRENRMGFEIQTHLGHKAVLAHVDLETLYKVSRYGVDIENLNSLIPEVSDFRENDLLYLDEIGQMELYSDKFRNLVIRYLDANNICIATISSVFEDSFTKLIKNRADVVVVELTLDTREEEERSLRKALQNLKSNTRAV